METFLAFVPFILVVSLLLAKVPAILSALIGIISVVIISQIAFPIQPDVFFQVSSALSVPAIEVVVILFSGVLLAEASEVVGAQKYISEWLVSVIGSRNRAVLLVALGITPFLESSIGFSVGIIVVAPILAKLGYTVTKTLALSVLGMFLCPWGALGPGLIITAELTDVSMHDLGVWSAIYSLPVIAIFSAAILIIAFPKGSRKAVMFDAFVMLMVLYIVLVLANVYINVALSGVIASLAAIAFIMFRGGAFMKHQRQKDPLLLKYLSPYGIMIGGLFSITLLKAFIPLESFERILSSPALWLFLASISSLISFSLPQNSLFPLITRTFKRWVNPTSTLVLFLLMGGLLNVTGISHEIAVAATSLGLWNLAIIPIISTLSGFITGSSSVVQAMFNTGTAAISNSIGFSTIHAMAIQNVAASAGTIAAPTRIVIGLAALAGSVSHPSQKLNQSKVHKATLGTNIAITTILIGLALLAWYY